MTDQYQRLTQAQVEIWLDDPVSKIYVQCLGWAVEQVKEQLANGSFIDSENNDLSMNKTHSAYGTQYGLEQASNLKQVLVDKGMIEEDKIETEKV